MDDSGHQSTSPGQLASLTQIVAWEEAAHTISPAAPGFLQPFMGRPNQGGEIFDENAGFEL